MQAWLSPSTGMLLSVDSQHEFWRVHTTIEDAKWRHDRPEMVISAFDDWCEVEAETEHAVIQGAVSEYWHARATSLLICALQQLSDELENDILEEVEEVLATHAETSKVLNRLLVAPLKESSNARLLAMKSLRMGFGATGDLLDVLRSLQPLLRRLAIVWCNVPESEFMDAECNRQEMWRSLSQEGYTLDLLNAPSANQFLASWNRQVFKHQTTPGRSAVARIGKLLANSLFPERPAFDYDAQAAWESDLFDSDFEPPHDSRHLLTHDVYCSVIRQVNAIAQAVSLGKDHKAHKFLHELIAAQIARGDETYAVKSLCNIAQRCAAMYRADFERTCLEYARRIRPDDAWALVQWGNHLKRVGEYDQAIRALRQAQSTSYSRVAASSIADVHARLGEYEAAIAKYKSIPSWDEIVEVRTGIADAFRRSGNLDEAESQYRRIRKAWPSTDRAVTGLAEIARRRGDLEQALALYDGLLERRSISDDDKLVFSSAKCSILKQARRFDEALELADQLVEWAPFMMQARILRASVLGLLGREALGVGQIPDSTSKPAFGEWVRHYVQGLLLLKLKRFAKARDHLIERLRHAVLTVDDKAIVRLGAAVFFLHDNNITEAESTLATIGPVSDRFIDHVRQVLLLHVAAIRSSHEQVDRIVAQLRDARENDKVLEEAIAALLKRDFQRAMARELEALLRIAA